MKSQVLREIKKELHEKFKFYIPFGGNLYSMELFTDDVLNNTTFDGQDYTVTISWSKSMDENDVELFTFYSIFFKNLLRKLEFERIGRNCFLPKKAESLAQHNLEVWPGFFSSMQKLEAGPLLMIDLTNKVVRSDKVLPHI